MKEDTLEERELFLNKCFSHCMSQKVKQKNTILTKKCISVICLRYSLEIPFLLILEQPQNPWLLQSSDSFLIPFFNMLQAYPFKLWRQNVATVLIELCCHNLDLSELLPSLQSLRPSLLMCWPQALQRKSLHCSC